MKGNGNGMTNEDLKKAGYSAEEAYFAKVNYELIRRIQEKREREKAAAAPPQEETGQRRQKKAA